MDPMSELSVQDQPEEPSIKRSIDCRYCLIETKRSGMLSTPRREQFVGCLSNEIDLYRTLGEPLPFWWALDDLVPWLKIVHESEKVMKQEVVYERKDGSHIEPLPLLWETDKLLAWLKERVTSHLVYEWEDGSHVCLCFREGRPLFILKSMEWELHLSSTVVAMS